MLPTSCGPGPPTTSKERKPPPSLTSNIDRTSSHASTIFTNTFLSSKTSSLLLSPPPPPPLALSSLSPSSSSESTSLIKNVGEPLTPRTFRPRDDEPKRYAGRRPILFCKTFSLQFFIKLFSIFCFLILTASNGASAEKSKNYYMRALCRNHFLQQLYRKIDGTVLWSQNERNLDCVITFQTHSILQRFMLRFDMLQLDCNDHLYVYDGAHPVGAFKADLSCRNTKQTVGSIFTRTNFVTLKYVTDGWGTDTNGFKLVITAVKDPKHACKDFRCAQREFCIHPDLVCDGINHCGDGSDESTSTLCQNQDPSTLLGLEITWFVLVAVSSVLVICACIVGLAICLCRRNTRNSSNQNTSIQLHQTLESNGSSKHLHGTLPREHTSLPSSGNWLHPAGPSGYLRIQHILKMATKVRPIWCLAN